MTEQNLSFIGLMKRAGALIPGADGIYDAARAGSLIRLILLASDAGPNTKKGLLNAKEECGAPMIQLEATKAQLGAILGQKECAAAAITDTGFAKALCEKLGETELAAQLAERQEREARRKAKKVAKKEAKPSAAENAQAAIRRKQAAAAKKGGTRAERTAAKAGKPVAKNADSVKKSAKPVAKTAGSNTKTAATKARKTTADQRTGAKSNTNKRGNRSW
jgi:ribosomal protein L30E